MKLKRILQGSASVLVLLTAVAPAMAQDQSMETVVVTGIRASVQRAMDLKRDSVSIVDAVSAEDIGKFPDKNVADALQRVPGVNTVSAASGEGGFDENDRVSVRGTNPSLTQTMVDGHSVANGDWFILDQYQAVGRSVSYTLLPSEIVDTAKVYKSQQADLVEGGVAGLIDIQTRKPLDFKDGITLEGTAEAVYSTLRGAAAPQFNAMFGYNGGNFAVMVQAFHEERQLRRDGQETLGYSTVGADSVTGIVHPDLVGVMYPTLIGSTYFTQQRVRQGGAITVQAKPSSSFEFTLNGFYSHLGATNYNQNYMYYGSQEIADNAPTSYKVVNNTLVQATFPFYSPLVATGGNGSHFAGGANWNPAGCGDTLPKDATGHCPVDGIVADMISRPGAGAETYYIHGEADWNPTSNLTLTAKAGYAHGRGNTPTQPAWEGEAHGSVSYDMTNGISGTTKVTNADVDLSNPAVLWNDWEWNDVFKANDREMYGQLDVEEAVKVGPITSIKAGARYADHKRTVLGWVSGVSYSATPGYSGADVTSGSYPSDYADSFSSDGMLTNVPLGDPSKIMKVLYTTPSWRSYFLTPQATMDPANQRFYWQGSFGVGEKDFAAYAMASFGGDSWKGNFGVRAVKTDDTVTQYVSDINGIANAFGNYRADTVKHTYWDILPSINLSVNLSDASVLRFGAAETMARPDYSALGGAVSLTDLIHVGTGGNADLKPVKAAVYNLSYEWYYGPQAMLSVGVFYNDLSSYVTYATHNGTYLDSTATGTHTDSPIYATYSVTAPVNSAGHVEGLEIAWQQPLYDGFGVMANYTYANGVDNNGGPLVGDSKNTANVTAYYENTWVSARVSYNYRSKMLVGLDRSAAENQDAIDSIDASVQFTITDNLALTFDGLNLTNRTLKYYANNITQPRALYSNGSQLYAGIRLKY